LLRAASPVPGAASVYRHELMVLLGTRIDIRGYT
jgi:hypothetical protein